MDLNKLHILSQNNKELLINSSISGCFHCLKLFHPKEIVDWIDNESTAICPYCGIDSIIGDNSEIEINKELLTKMNSYWFSK